MVAAAPIITWSALAATAAALAGVLALIWGLQMLARTRLRPRGGGRRLQLTETIALDARRRLHLITCDGRSLLIQTGGTENGAISWLPDHPA